MAQYGDYFNPSAEAQSLGRDYMMGGLGSRVSAFCTWRICPVDFENQDLTY